MLLYRPPPPPAAAAASVTADIAAGAGDAGVTTEIPVVVEQPPTSTANETGAATGASTATATGLPSLDVKTNPELPSPARVRWMDAFSRVCAHLNQVRAVRV